MKTVNKSVSSCLSEKLDHNVSRASVTLETTVEKKMATGTFTHVQTSSFPTEDYTLWPRFRNFPRNSQPIIETLGSVRSPSSVMIFFRSNFRRLRKDSFVRLVTQFSPTNGEEFVTGQKCHGMRSNN